MKIMKLKLNTPLDGYQAGQTVAVQTDRANVPLERFWRRRIKDAEIDNCVEVVRNTKPSKPKKELDK